jgi:hypothetical protein
VSLKIKELDDEIARFKLENNKLKSQIRKYEDMQKDLNK